MIDENAFGLALSYHHLEDDEYATEDRVEFVRRFRDFEETGLRAFLEAELPEDRTTLCLGHALYVEFHDAGDTPRLVTQARAISRAVLRAGYENAAALAFGGRWVPESGPATVQVEQRGLATTARVSAPSEPLRRCLAALVHAADQEAGWGPGLYVDLEAAEAVGLKLKNEPTLLHAGGASFFRLPVKLD